jgi:CBS domain-containing protein/Flp pilus assembly pilin Flp
MGDERGASAVEYALILALVPIVAIAGLDWCGTSVQRPFGEIATRLNHDSAAADSDAAVQANAPAGRASAAAAESARVENRSWQLNLDSLRFPLTMIAAGTLAAGLVMVRRRQNRERLLSLSSEDATPCPLQSERVAQKRQQILRQLARDMQLVVTNQVEVRQIMTPDPMVVLPTTLIDTLAPQMIERRTRHLLVCDQRGQLLGVISDRDILARNGRRAADIMTRVVASVSSDSPLGPAITLMLNRQISSLPVVDNGQLRGIITTSDVLMTLQSTLHLLSRGDDQIETQSGTTISQLCAGRPLEPSSSLTL